MRVFVVTPPQPVVSLDEAKAHLRVEGGDEDLQIAAFVAAATGHIDGPDGWLGRAIGAQMLEARCSSSDCGSAVRLPFPPVIELVSASYLDSSGVEQMADADDFEIMGRDLVAVSGAWPWGAGSSRREGVRIRYRAGYETVPATIKAAILLMVGDLYTNRETVSDAKVGAVPMSLTVHSLLAPFQVFS